MDILGNRGRGLDRIFYWELRSDKALTLLSTVTNIYCSVHVVFILFYLFILLVLVSFKVQGLSTADLVHGKRVVSLRFATNQMLEKR